MVVAQHGEERLVLLPRDVVEKDDLVSVRGVDRVVEGVELHCHARSVARAFAVFNVSKW